MCRNSTVDRTVDMLVTFKTERIFSYKYVQFVIRHKPTLHVPKNKISVVSRPELYMNYVQGFPVSHIKYRNRSCIFSKCPST
jgi:hypothetical protein